MRRRAFFEPDVAEYSPEPQIFEYVGLLLVVLALLADHFLKAV